MKFRPTILAFILVLAIPARPQTLQRIPPSKRPQGMVGYYLGKINPSDRDYGAQLTETRSKLVGETVDDFYFWSNVVTLSLLGFLGIWLVLQQRSKNKVEIIASHLIAQLWNGRASDRVEIANRTRRYNEIVDELNDVTEKKLSEKTVIRKKGVASNDSNLDLPTATPDQSKDGDAPVGPGVIPRDEPPNKSGILVETPTAAVELVPPVVVDETINTSQNLNHDAGDVEEMRKALHASRMEVEQMMQELKVGQGQIQALKNRENNLILQLNQAVEFGKQQNDRTAPVGK